MNAVRELLMKSVSKYIELKEKPGWNIELIEKAPPILWFGDANTKLPRIITIGANPSREEFLAHHKKHVRELICDSKQSNIKYLSQPRFKTLTEKETIHDVIYNENLQDEIIQSYNNYFSDKGNPYTNWFGKSGGFKVEAFLNGLNASYYLNNSHNKFTAIHMDLFPFATISDFKEICHLTEKDLFENGWAQNFLANLIELIAPDPAYILVFGRTNYNYFKSFFSEYIKVQKGKKRYHQSSNGKKVTSTYWLGTYHSHKLIGLSVNLGNPRSFTTRDLNSFGKEILKELNC
ncbi:hypothetical protein ABEP42_13905 [Priestia megaterium]|uniref:hypothetical protein n=1 Tax=Priestia megaterium TaxID=1404 RepID=UPI003182146B